MEPKLYCSLSSTENLLSILNCLRANQNTKILILAKHDGLLLQSSSSSFQIMGEGFLKNFDFDIYNVATHEVELMVDLKILRQAVIALSSGNMPRLVMVYPSKDNKLLLYVKDDLYATKFYLETFLIEEIPSLDLSEKVNGMFTVKDSRFLKQALEVCCHGRHEVNIFVSFDNQTQSCSFTRDDLTAGIKTRVILPQCESVDTEIEESSERLYSGKVLRGVANFPKADEIQVKMYDEGILEFCISFNDRAWFKHFINPSTVDPEFGL